MFCSSHSYILHSDVAHRAVGKLALHFQSLKPFHKINVCAMSIKHGSLVYRQLKPAIVCLGYFSFTMNNIVLKSKNRLQYNYSLVMLIVEHLHSVNCNYNFSGIKTNHMVINSDDSRLSPAVLISLHLHNLYSGTEFLVD